MKKYSLLAMLLLTSNFATAQELKSPVVLEKVNYVRSFPAALRAYIPKGGKSRFWGETKLKYQGKSVWVHVYDVKNTDFSDKSNGRYGTQESGLDLFIPFGKQKLRRISSTHFKYSRYGGNNHIGAFQSVEIKMLWLDPKTKMIPIMQLNLIDPNGFLGTVVDEILFVFVDGFNKPSVEQGFGSGSSNGSGMNSWQTSFGDVDEQGFVTLNHAMSSAESQEIMSYRWDGNHFVSFKVNTKEWGGEQQIN